MCISDIVKRMSDSKKILLQNPSDNIVHLGFVHPVYSDHYVTDCGMVVTTSHTRHETNLTGFVIMDSSEEITCDLCKQSIVE